MTASPITASLRGWLGRKDSNLRIRDPKSRALPLGHAPLFTPGVPAPVTRFEGRLAPDFAPCRRFGKLILQEWPEPCDANGKCIRWAYLAASLRHSARVSVRVTIAERFPRFSAPAASNPAPFVSKKPNTAEPLPDIPPTEQ